MERLYGSGLGRETNWDALVEIDEYCDIRVCAVNELSHRSNITLHSRNDKLAFAAVILPERLLGFRKGIVKIVSLVLY